MGLHTQHQYSSLDHTWISLVCIITFYQDFWKKFMTVWFLKRKTKIIQSDFFLLKWEQFFSYLDVINAVNLTRVCIMLYLIFISFFSNQIKITSLKAVISMLRSSQDINLKEHWEIKIFQLKAPINFQGPIWDTLDVYSALCSLQDEFPPSALAFWVMSHSVNHAPVSQAEQ